ncbi:hypothetical protein L1S35_02305 [Flavobacterium sp. AS60]|uniref:hypothetical protein n=1 Tax=Flavobacterium anseongense TaxID=2910677 RepID=UPI001F376386|nr:hypothetical protein [Flavobacterium sp. AS60]MCF6128487.1 hypothetical protein [Flavobacterium sp. AS60]
MKKTALIFIATMLLTACSSDSNPEDGLPKETQTGANTFGCLIDGKLFLPRSGNNSIVDPLSGAILSRGFPEASFDYYELEITDYKSSHRAKFLFHMHNVPNNGTGTFEINESNGMRDVDGYAHNYIYCVVFDKSSDTYQKYVSYENSGSFTITTLIIGPATGSIISGTFNCKLRNINNPNDEIEITKGRFDVNSRTIMQTYFP